jgi:hypothetical protein
LGTIVAALGTVGFVEYSSQPVFCKTCHIMVPYYDSWVSSSHNDVPCVKCHYAPGIRAEAMGKFQAANQVVKYVTGAYGTKPWAEVEDDACLRSGCHVERMLEGEVVYRGILFDHTDHLGELRRGKQLRCTSCHSQIVQGDHVAVTESTCYLCHFKGRDAGDPVAGCIGCHPSPERAVSPAGFVVDHPQYVHDLVSCISCHDEVVSGSGQAEQARCFTCHNEPERIDQFEDTEVIHRVHIADENVECTQCHIPIEHRVASLPTVVDLDCSGCHQGAHDTQQRMYAGLGGHGTENQPSAMFLASVSCYGCHELPAEVEGHEQVQLAGEASCFSCHGIRYANILPSWQASMDQKLGVVADVVAGAENALGAAGVRTRARADSLVGLARENLDFVQLGKAAHNIGYADDLLRATLDLIRDAVNLGLPYVMPEVDLGPAVGESTCMACHLGVERRESTFRGRSFDHESHVLGGAMACAECHTSFDEHGETTLASASSCDNCHHPRIAPMNCAQCHPGPGGAPAETLVLESGDLSHSLHRDEGVECAACHEGPTMSSAELDCQSCHVEHHEPETSCLACHREGAMEDHDRTDHVTCTECHDPPADQFVQWTREICTSCHAELTDHQEDDPRGCEECHQIAPLGATDSDPADPTPRGHQWEHPRGQEQLGHGFR